MPNSLKCRLKKFVHKGLLSEKDLSIIYTDNDVIEELEAIKAEIKRNQNLYYYNKKTDTYEDIIKFDTVLKVIDNHIEELKGENKC